MSIFSLLLLSLLSVSLLIAKFHYTDPTGPDRTRTDFFAAKLRWVRAGLRQSPCGSVRVRAGPVGSSRARVVEFSYKRWVSTTRTRPDQTAGLAFGGTGLCSYRVRGVGGSRAEHLTVESYTIIIISPLSYLLSYLLFAIKGINQQIKIIKPNDNKLTKTQLCRISASETPQLHHFIIGIPSPTHSFTLGLNPSFSANPPYPSLSFFLIQVLLYGFPRLFTLLVSISVFLLFSFSVFTLF